MNQPPDDNFYNSSTENTKLPPQQWQGQAPGYPQRPQPAPNNYPSGPGPQNFPPSGPGPQNFPPRGPQSQPGMGPQSFPQQGPMGQPGVGPGPQSQPGFGQQRGPGFPQPQGQGPLSQPGFGPPNAAQGPISQQSFGSPNASTVPGFNSQNYARPLNQPGAGQQRGPVFPPPGGPLSQPGFSSAGYPQQEQYTAQPPPWPGNNPQSGNPGPPWEQQQQFNASARQQQSNGSANWPDPALSQTAARPKKSRLWLAIVLVLLAIVVIGGGTFVLFTHKGNNLANTPTTQGTSTTNGVTPVATKSASTPTASSAFHSIGTPVQAGTDWIVTITGVKETTSSLFGPNAGNTYLEVSLTLKNISGNTLQLVSIIEFTLVDAGGHRYNETAADTNIHSPADGNVNSNQTLAAQIAYEVPKNQHTFTLTFAYGLIHNNGASIAWKFTV